jgi:hypothetical protein
MRQLNDKLRDRRNLDRLTAEAQPMAVPETKGLQPQHEKGSGPNGPEQRSDGVEPKGASSAPARAGAPAVTTGQNGLWTGAYAQNPNRQIGKLYFDADPGPGVRWSHCSATAINSENKSLVVTAGHCVYNPDPDGNLQITGNGYWNESFFFCPGYENSCKLGRWAYRSVSTTNSWTYGVGSDRRYSFHDDVAVVLVQRDLDNRYLVDAVGGQGITFNVATGLTRHLFGYPVSDRRFPEYTYNGKDLVYCGGTDTPDPTLVGTMYVACTMTGGASGGPWLTSPNSLWGGYVNSVNSHKTSGPFMSGPYFDTTESNLFQYWRNR